MRSPGLAETACTRDLRAQGRRKSQFLDSKLCRRDRARTSARTNRRRLPMKSLDELLVEAEHAHGHLCAGQILGVRMAMLGLQKLGIGDPRGKDRKRLITYVEIDRCATDAISVVTGC